MDQIKIGKFISQCRKEQGLTQAKLAEQLGITDRAVSKWETGKSLPDSSIMLDLCSMLKINVNELLSGERIMTESYDKKAEDNLLNLKKENEEQAKKLLNAELILGIGATAAFLILVFTASFTEMSPPVKIGLIAAGIIIFATGIGYCLMLEQAAGYYECADCGYRYKPDYKQVFFALHIGRSRKMTCPHCGKRNYHKKVISRDSE